MAGETLVNFGDVSVVVKWADTFNAGQLGRTITGYRSIYGKDIGEAGLKFHLGSDFAAFKDAAMQQIIQGEASDNQ